MNGSFSSPPRSLFHVRIPWKRFPEWLHFFLGILFFSFFLFALLFPHYWGRSWVLRVFNGIFMHFRVHPLLRRIFGRPPFFTNFSFRLPIPRNRPVSLRGFSRFSITIRLIHMARSGWSNLCTVASHRVLLPYRVSSPCC